MILASYESLNRKIDKLFGETEEIKNLLKGKMIQLLPHKRMKSWTTMTILMRVTIKQMVVKMMYHKRIWKMKILVDNKTKVKKTANSEQEVSVLYLLNNI